jgi:hypothetical protein
LGCSRGGVTLFEHERRDPTEGGVPSAGIVPAFDPIKDGHFGFGLGAEAAAREQLAFERREETFRIALS